MLFFMKGGKPKELEKKNLGAEAITNNKLNPHATLGSGIKPRLQQWEANTLTTAPSLFLKIRLNYVLKFI
mgnify:CR=1 FL=1